MLVQVVMMRLVEQTQVELVEQQVQTVVQFVTVGGTTNTGLTTQDLINDYLQSPKVLTMNILNPAIDYYNIGNIGFNPLGKTQTFLYPMNSTIDFFITTYSYRPKRSFPRVCLL